MEYKKAKKEVVKFVKEVNKPYCKEKKKEAIEEKKVKELM